MKACTVDSSKLEAILLVSFFAPTRRIASVLDTTTTTYRYLLTVVSSKHSNYLLVIITLLGNMYNITVYQGLVWYGVKLESIIVYATSDGHNISLPK